MNVLHGTHVCHKMANIWMDDTKDEKLQNDVNYWTNWENRNTILVCVSLFIYMGQ